MYFALYFFSSNFDVIRLLVAVIYILINLKKLFLLNGVVGYNVFGVYRWILPKFWL